MNKIVVGLTILMVFSLTTIVFCDGVIIPCSIKEEAFKKEMKKHGMDLYGNDDSDGKIENNGTSFKVITFRPVTIEQMDLIKDTAVKCRRI